MVYFQRALKLNPGYVCTVGWVLADYSNMQVSLRTHTDGARVHGDEEHARSHTVLQAGHRGQQEGLQGLVWAGADL